MFNRKTFGALALVLIAWAPWLIPAAYSAVWQWSETASSNASADPQINWREGQPPSSVNDSARAMMAALASYRDDISGLLTTTGTSTAYLVTTNQNICAAPATVPQDGQLLALTMSSTNGINPMLAADGCTNYPIQSAPGVAVGAASLIQGSPYTFRFSVSNSAWMLRDFYGSAVTVPLGGMIPYTGTTVPNSNFVFPAGQCLSTTTYASYWVFSGSPASGSCSGGQFQIIDLSGRVPAGLDTMPGFSAAGRLTSATNGCGTAMTSVGAACTNGKESSQLVTLNLPPYTPSGTNAASAVTFPGSVVGTVQLPGSFTFPIAQSGTPFGATAAAQVFTGTPQGGLSQQFSNVLPVVGVTYLLRVI